MINYKRLLFAILLGSLVVFGVRRYTINWAVETMYFGCKEAALKEYRFFSVKDGNALDRFCDARNKAVKEEFNW